MRQFTLARETAWPRCARSLETRVSGLRGSDRNMQESLEERSEACALLSASRERYVQTTGASCDEPPEAQVLEQQALVWLHGRQDWIMLLPEPAGCAGRSRLNSELQPAGQLAGSGHVHFLNCVRNVLKRGTARSLC